MQQERRKHPRFKMKDGTFVYFVETNVPINLAQIVDISLGGISLRYFARSNTESEMSELKIMGYESRSMHLIQMKCSPVYERETDMGPMGTFTARFCGAEFKEVTPGQQTLLESFISNFGIPST
jgi:c-di-GMP-binding flagellar brake protein YcgR